MIFDAVKRFLGIGDATAPTRHSNESPSAARNDEFVPHRHQMPPDIHHIETEIAEIHKFMEQQMHSMMGSFGFTFGSPFSGFGFEDNSQIGPFFRFSPGIQDIPHPDVPPDPKPLIPALNPRDEVLKPQFRSGQWNGQDQILDDRLNNEGFGFVINEIKPSDEVCERNNPMIDGFSSIFGNGLFRNGLFGHGPFGNGPLGHAPGLDSGSMQSSSTVTIYSNVNGHKSVEKIVRHRDGKIERTVISDDGNPEKPL